MTSENCSEVARPTKAFVFLSAHHRSHGRLIQYLLDELDAGEQIHAEVDKGPIDTFFLIFLLL